MTTSIRDQLLREVASLPVEQAGRVLDSVRWLKVAGEPDAELADARAHASAAGITDGDIAREIAEHRAHA